VRTDANGTANVPWAPRAKLKFVDVDPVSPDWKIDQTDLEHIADRVVTMHVRRKIPITSARKMLTISFQWWSQIV
jgi:hypothetical protein